MIEPFLGKRGLFIFSDPGGAKACLALSLLLHDEDVILISDREYSFYKDFNLNVRSYSEKLITDWFESFLPEYIFTGTSVPEKIEIKFIKEANKRNIYSYSIIDHWIHLKERFYSYGKYYFPNELWVIDEEASQNAKREGISSEILYISGNPYYIYLKNWEPSICKKEMLIKMGLPDNANYILYAPEPISTFHLQEKYGYTEITGLEYLVEYLNNIKYSNIFVVVKCHPNQNFNLFRDFINNLGTNRIILSNDMDINLLIYYSEVVTGYFSNSLVEASIMNKKVIRILINLLNKQLDPLKNKNIGFTVFSYHDLQSKLNSVLRIV